MTIVGVAALAITLLAAIAERRRLKRRDIEAIGFMPWPAISILATVTALFSFALAIRFGG